MNKKLNVQFTDPEAKAIWQAVLRAKAEVESWPGWKRGDTPSSMAEFSPPGPEVVVTKK